ncbi:DNRLRE domain-containing protein [bacterium]|nr:DNRLRE domain-containing protein [bacterium]
MLRSFLLTVPLLSLLAPILRAEVAQFVPSKDNTLFQQVDPSQQRSNGLGDMTVGRTNQDGSGPATISIRRGLLAFDIASQIPTGSIITDVVLSMRDVQGLNGDPTVNLHRVLTNWGEGTSFQNGGQGALATNGDATWLYTFFNASSPNTSPIWTTPGGDFTSLSSGSAVIFDDLGGGQLFSWSSSTNPLMIDDVQFWLDNPASNFGWILIGDESRGQTAKRFTSREGSVPPVLQVTYSVVPEASVVTLMGVAGMIAFGVGIRSRLHQRP